MRPPAALVEDFAITRWPDALRPCQQAALDALARAWDAGRRRAWLVMPPGTGKTLVGLEAARRLGRPIVVFGSNAAIQEQWVAHWRRFTPQTVPVGVDRALDTPVTVLTYQALAPFDPEFEVDEDGRQKTQASSRARLLRRLHPNSHALVEALRRAGPLTLILDEAHHLLEVWGRLLAEILSLLPDAHVLGLTATPPETLTAHQSEPVDALFGEIVYAASVPAVIREGHLAPFAELVWLTEPTPREREWLAGEAERFREFTTDLLDPGFATTGFLEWLEARFITRTAGPGLTVSWSRIEKDHPELARAAMRFHHAGLLSLPPGARLREEHRHPPTTADWVALLDDFVRRCLRRSADPRDAVALTRIRVALPAVGHRLTARGICAGPSPVDRVLARSEAKTHAAVEIVAAEAANLGERLRALVLCDHERATATLPARLVGVLAAQAGSARFALANLAADPRTARLGPMLVTGRTVAAPAATARAFVAWAAHEEPHLSIEPIPAEATGAVEINGSWTSRTWVRLVTHYFERGHCRVLVGTRALLGEGWDAACVNTLVDLTAATTTRAIVQTRGRALRLDPAWPGKVANNWTVTCVTDAHPGGDADYGRLVRKHAGYLAVDDAGVITSGVAHLDAALSPYSPPPVAGFDAVNARMLRRAERRGETRDAWQVGQPYADQLVHTIYVKPAPSARRIRVAWDDGAASHPPALLPAARGAVRQPQKPAPSLPRWWILPLAVVLGVLGGLAAPLLGVLFGLAAVAAAVGARRHAAALAAGRELAELAAGTVNVGRLACAVAEALYTAEELPVGAEGVRLRVDAHGVYRVCLFGVDEAKSAVFAAALDEVLSPMAAPRYVIARYAVTPPPPGRRALARTGRAWLDDRAAPNPVVYHAVPRLLAVNRARVKLFEAAWSRWVSAGQVVYAGSPEGEGILVTHRGVDPLAVTTALRVAWE